MSRGV